MRADQLIVQQGLAPSRSAAQRLIAHGAVRWRLGGAWLVPKKAGEDLPEQCTLEVVDGAELRYVSRGGLKLEGALARCGIDPGGTLCLDVGQGTGGFTDVLLQRGAQSVVGIEVGHGQLHPRLREEPRVSVLEGVNARHLVASQLPHQRFDLIVGDVSFISLSLVLPALAPLVAGELLMLVKPQFELQATDIGKGGIVRDARAFARVEQRLREATDAVGMKVVDWFKSPIEGGDGNTEFFVRARPAPQRQLP